MAEMSDPIWTTYSIDELELLLTDLESHYSTRDDWFGEYEDVYTSDVWEEDPRPEEERVTLPTGQNIIDMAVGLVSAKDPVLVVPPSRDTQKSERSADKVEKYLRAMFEDAGGAEAYRQAAWGWFCHGWCAARLWWDDDELADGEHPICIRNLYPGSVYPAFDRRGRPVSVFITEETTVRNIRLDFPGALPGYRMQDTVTLVEYWERIKNPDGKPSIVNAIWVQGIDAYDEDGDRPPQWVRQPINVAAAYPEIPVIIHRANAVPIPQKGEWEGVSLLHAITQPDQPSTGLVRYANRLFAQLAQVIADYSDPVRIVKSNEGSLPDMEGRPGFEFDTTHGAVNFLRETEDAYYLEWRSSQPGIQQQWNVTEKQIERASFPPVLFGEFAPDLSGIALNVLATPTMAKLAAHQRGLRSFLEDIFRIALKATEANMDDKLPFWASIENRYEEITLKKSDIGGYYKVRARLSADLPKDVAGMLAVIGNLRANELLSQRSGIDLVQQYLEHLKQSPEDEIRRLRMEKLLNSEEMTRAMAMNAAKKYSPEVYRLMMEQMQGQGQAGQPGPGQPGLGPEAQGVPPNILPPEAQPFAGDVEAGLQMTGQPLPGQQPTSLTGPYTDSGQGILAPSGSPFPMG